MHPDWFFCVHLAHIQHWTKPKTEGTRFDHGL